MNVEQCLHRFLGKCPNCKNDEYNLICKDYKPIKYDIYYVYDDFYFKSLDDKKEQKETFK